MTERMTRNETWGYIEAILTNLAVAEKGKLACVDTGTGLIVLGAVSTTLRPIGLFDETKTGDGTLTVRIRLFDEIRIHWFDNDLGGTAVVVGDFGGLCYIFDDETVTGDATGASPAGRVWAVNTTNGVAVEMVGFDDSGA